MKLLTLFCLCCLGGCAPINQISFCGGVGDELRPTETRLSAKSGIETKLENGAKVKATYRGRTTDLRSDKVEHGFFFDVSIPIWKRQ